MERKDLTYFPDNENDFNGVLFVLREPHKIRLSETNEQTLIGNRKWFRKIAEIDAEEASDDKALLHRYKNRFNEMMVVCEKARYRCFHELQNTAYTNIKQTGGGKTASQEYWKISAEDKYNILKQIIECVKPKVEVIFLPRELFKIVLQKHPCYEPALKDGLIYRKQTAMKKVQIDGITYYEIFHPVHRRTIKIP